jgi:acetyltransferase-like isoleucine patch superfamily enzyme
MTITFPQFPVSPSLADDLAAWANGDRDAGRRVTATMPRSPRNHRFDVRAGRAVEAGPQALRADLGVGWAETGPPSVFEIATVRSSVPRSAHIGHMALVGEGVTLGEGARIGARVTVGDGASIGAGAVIGAGSEIGAGAVIAAGAVVGGNVTVHDGVVVGAGARVSIVPARGWEGHIRPTTIARDVPPNAVVGEGATI